MTFNPGFAGHENAICAVAAYRSQWDIKDESGVKISPETYFISINSPVRVLRGGLSAMVLQDKIGYFKNILVKVGYAYQKNVGFGKLGIGAQIEFNNKSLDFSKLHPVEPDPALLTSNESDMLIDFSLGLYYGIPGSYHIGISGQHLLNTKGKSLIENTKLNLDRTFYLDAGYELIFRNNPDFEFDPSILLESDVTAIQLNLAALLKYKDTFWGGIGYRFMSHDAVELILGVKYKDFRIGYSYDVNTSKLRLPFGGGAHEIMLNYCFKLNLEKGRKSYKNTRFL
jgi:type IX secretion system PorP/SprF family membrane protein